MKTQIIPHLRPLIISRIPLRFAVLLTVLFLLGNVRAQTLLLDFGATTVLPEDAASSVGHFAGAVSPSDISWNKITADTASGLVFADGSPATGVSVELGRSGAGVNDTINFALNTFSSSALGGQLNMGIYVGSSPIKDGMFATGTSSVNTNAFGIRVSGLPAGTYTIYLAGRNTSTAVSAPQRFFGGAGVSATTFTFSTTTNPWVDQSNAGTPVGGGNPNTAHSLTSTFGYGNNCAHLEVTLAEGDSLYLAAIGIAANEYRGFLNSVEIVPGAPVLNNFLGLIARQPVGGQTYYEGATISFTNVNYAGVPPLFYQWQLNGVDLAGETGPGLTLNNVTGAQSGDYSVIVSNLFGWNVSSNAAVSVVPLFNTAQMTNLWNLLPGERFYITTTDGGERGLAYNPVTSNLLVVTHVPTNNIVVLDPETGAERYFMNIENVPQTGAGINLIGVGTDGMIYTVGATPNAGSPSTPLNLIWWANDDVNTPPGGFAFNGDPGQPDLGVGAANLRWGDSFAVRGSGTTAQLLLGPGSGTNVCLFATGDGMNFTPNIITITNEVPSGFAQHGIAFGPGTNTFWATTLNQAFYLVEFDLTTGTGAVIFSATNVPPGSFRFISTDPENKWLAGVMRVASGLPENVRLYDIADFTNAIVLADQELYPVANNTAFLNGAGSGSTAFGGDFLFALNSNNGLMAFRINSGVALAPFSITSSATTDSIILSWPSVTGHTYQVQAVGSLTSGGWTNAGVAIPGTGAALSYTNELIGPGTFFRVQAQ